MLFCSDWCVEWSALKERGCGDIRLPIVQPQAADRDAAAVPSRTAPVDMVMMNILNSTMVSICREMGILLMKTSYSTIFNEGLDFTCALCRRQGRHDRLRRVLPDHDRRHAAADQDAARRRSPSRRCRRATSWCTTTPIAAACIARSTPSSSRSSSTASCSASPCASAISPRSAAWCRAPSAARRPRSSMRGCASRPLRSRRRATTSKKSGSCCSPTHARRGRTTATSAR